jgi:hypothetical protein
MGWAPKSVSISGDNGNIDGLWNAMDFLTAARKPGMLNLKGQTGGDWRIRDGRATASACRQDVYVIYRRSFEMPAWSRTRSQPKGIFILTQPIGLIRQMVN